MDGQNLAPPAHAYFKRVRHQAPHPLRQLGILERCKTSAMGTNLVSSLSEPMLKRGRGES